MFLSDDIEYPAAFTVHSAQETAVASAVRRVGEAVPDIRLCKICGGPSTPRHAVAGITYYHCPSCDFLQNYYWEDHQATPEEQRADNEQSLDAHWRPGDAAHERQKALEIIALMTSPIAWTSRRVHGALKYFPGYVRWSLHRSQPKLRTMLDFGCGHGATTMALRACGIPCIGVDPYVPQETPYVLRTSVPNPRLTEGSFDGICAIETMEHMTDVLGTFRALHTLLRPGGVLLVQTRRLEDPDYQLQGAGWFYLRRPRQHVAIYSKQALTRIARQVGFSTVRFRGVKFARFIA